VLGGWWEDGWCVECGCVIHDHDKPWMLARGVWVVGERGRVEKAANGAKAANAANAAEAAATWALAAEARRGVSAVDSGDEGVGSSCFCKSGDSSGSNKGEMFADVEVDRADEG
jgi:hypothetical protein